MPTTTPNPDKVQFNLHNLHVAVKSSSGFATPVAVPGAVALNLSRQGSETLFFADGIRYYVANHTSGYSGDLEIAKMTQALETLLFGATKTTDGVIVEKIADKPAEFALLFEIDGDSTGEKYVLYNCVASRPNIVAGTDEDGHKIQSCSMSLSVSPLANGMIKAHTCEETTSSVASGWYTTVWQPTTSGGST